MNEHKSAHLQASLSQKKVRPLSLAPDASTPLAEAPVFGTKVCCTSVPSVNLLVPEVIAWAW